VAQQDGLVGGGAAGSAVAAKLAEAIGASRSSEISKLE
jgi:hypothetical protein